MKWIWNTDLNFFLGKILVKLLMNKIHIQITYYDFSTQNTNNIILKCLIMMDMYTRQYISAWFARNKIKREKIYVR